MAIRWARRIGTAAMLALLIPYLNYFCEFAGRVAVHLGPNCPRYLSLLAEFGLSWNVCYFFTAVVFVLVADYGMKYFPKLERIPIPLMLMIALICGSVFMVVDVLHRYTIPMVGGFLGTWPDGYWDWPSTFTFLAISLLALWLGSKVYALVKRRGS
jgi:hypothetical protein